MAALEQSTSWRHGAFGRLASLRRGRVASAAGLTTAFHVASQVLRLGGNLVLTRILAPDLFGVMSIVMAIQTTLMLLTDVGLRSVVIQSTRGEDRSLLDTVFSVQVVRGFVIWGITVALAAGLFAAQAGALVPAGSAWAATELPAVLVVFGLTTVIAGFQSVNVLIAGRKLDLKRVLWIELVAQVISLAAMILLALATRSIWSMVHSAVIGALISTLLSHFWLAGPRSRFGWDKSALGEIWRFGIWIFASSTVFVLSSNVDRFILAGLMGTRELGLYAIALSLMMTAEAIGSRVVQSVVLPALSEAARIDGDTFRKAYFRYRRLLDACFCMSAGGLFALGPTIVTILYDHRYAEAGTILQALSFLLVNSRYGVTTMGWVALGEPRLMAALNAVKLAAVVAGIYVGYELAGTAGAVWAIALHWIVLLPLTYYFNGRHRMNDFVQEFAGVVWWVGGWAAGLAAVWLFHATLPIG